MFVRSAAALTAVSFMGIAGSAQASVVWSGFSGSLAASADFDVDGSGNLHIVLTNTSTADVMNPAEVLTAVFFDISGPAINLSRVSVMLAGGSTVYYDADGQPASGNVGGEWGYGEGGLSIGTPGTLGYGVSSTGIGLFGPGDLFPGPNLSGPDSPDGPQYGLLSAGDDTMTGNGGITGSGGLIKNSVEITLGGAGTDFDLSRITRVYFFYGTAFGEGGFDGTPSPSALAFLGVAGLAAGRRRR